ncbi:MAG: rhodanese-like domain-containing protein [Gammaproteobacteria bacterium]
MRIIKKATLFALVLPLTALFAPVASAEEPPCPFNESRSGLCGHYHSQISPAEAFLETVVKRGKWTNRAAQPVLLDVRSTPEYKAGHPEHSYNVPYPFIYQECENRSPDGACIGGGARIMQDPDAFVRYVESIVPDKDTPIYTLCRTGVRSVGAANVLTDAGYTHVRNVWEGFVGIYLTAPKVQADASILTLPVDLNHDGALNDEDKNGWRNHQKLPYETRLLPKLIYQPMAYLYDLD